MAANDVIDAVRKLTASYENWACEPSGTIDGGE
jgi:hypothetical protein